MRIDALTLEGFRNYDRQSLTFHNSCNVIYGENAQGKTNLLEAVAYLFCGRRPPWQGGFCRRTGIPPAPAGWA